jgi:hypothetical protein
MKVAINYADANFKKAQTLNTKTAKKKGGFDRVIEYGPHDIDYEFKEKHKEIFNQKRGGGYWLWKPYIIKKTLQSLEWGDYLFYCDSGAFYINSINKLIDSLEENQLDIMAFENPLIEKQWTKEDCFILMQCVGNEYKNTNQRIATYILFKKTKNVMKFVDEYLNFCANNKIVTDEQSTLGTNDELFIDHRHDQSVFSLLTKKYNIPAFREPSQYGKRPWEYFSNNRLYNSKKYMNSNYPSILISYRKASPCRFYLKEKIKDLLQIYNLRFIK